MFRPFPLLLIAACLPGCAWMPASPADAPPVWPDGPAAQYDFDWRLSGDRAVAPLQVFDDGRDTWLQFPAGQAVPAVFGVRDGAERLLPYRRLDPYVLVQGVWQSLVMRGGAMQARADYRGEGRRAGTGGMPAPAEGSAPVQLLPVEPVPSPAAAPSSEPPTSAPASAAASGAPVFHAGPADANMRRALARWARLADWTFAPEHWTPDVDIPLAGAAEFPADFKQAVRQLLAATELSDRPLQPCFYSNRVLRVVPLAQACDRTAPHAGAAS